MNSMSTVGMGRGEALIDALRAELGGILAERAIEAEAAEFLWESRVRERYLGQHFECMDDDDCSSDDVSRMAFLSFLDDRWHAGVCLVDGEAAAVELLWKRAFLGFGDAEIAFLTAR